MLSCTADFQFFIFLCLVNLNNMSLTLVFFFKFSQNFHNIFFLVISKYQIYCFVRFQFSLVSLYITSCCYYHRIRVHLFRLVKHLTGLTVCNICYRTGIYYVNISTWFKRYNFIPCLFQKLLHSFQLIRVYFTSKIV